MGHIVDSFHCGGNLLVLKIKLKSVVSGFTKITAQSFNKKAGTPSGPLVKLGFSFFRNFRTKSFKRTDKTGTLTLKSQLLTLKIEDDINEDRKNSENALAMSCGVEYY